MLWWSHWQSIFVCLNRRIASIQRLWNLLICLLVWNIRQVLLQIGWQRPGPNLASHLLLEIVQLFKHVVFVHLLRKVVGAAERLLDFIGLVHELAHLIAQLLNLVNVQVIALEGFGQLLVSSLHCLHLASHGLHALLGELHLLQVELLVEQLVAPRLQHFLFSQYWKGALLRGFPGWSWARIVDCCFVLQQFNIDLFNLFVYNATTFFHRGGRLTDGGRRLRILLGSKDASHGFGLT
mmetsp:Transcript_28348/g.54010  ORF Transcript_28348/g.54010 Transcript_28348/m.54010 type:complete len:237 (-) Transcript_28348:217-927(-)